MPASTSGIFSPTEIYRRIAGGKLGRWNPTEVMEGRLDNDWPSPTPYATNLVTPTSISSTGTGNSSSIGANGSVTFSSCATLSLNGVFTSDYDNYMIVCRQKSSSTAGPDLFYRLRASGSDNSTASSYTHQFIYGKGASVTGGRASSDQAYLTTTWGRDEGFILSMYGPFLVQPTASRQFGVIGYTSGTLLDIAHTHNQSVSYDGISFIMQSTYTFGGLVSVYGLGV